MADINSPLEIGVTTGPIRGSRKVPALTCTVQGAAVGASCTDQPTLASATRARSGLLLLRDRCAAAIRRRRRWSRPDRMAAASALHRCP